MFAPSPANSRTIAAPMPARRLTPVTSADRAISVAVLMKCFARGQRTGVRRLVALRFAFVNGDAVAVRICDQREIADGALDVIRQDLDARLLQMIHRNSKVLNLQRH